jgi:hypothetical protein
MKFILYSHLTETSIRDNLGQPEYSYYFVLKGYQSALEELGSVELVQHPETEVDAIFKSCSERGEPCVFLSFAPPHQTVLHLECPTIPVIAWEFSTIPNEPWNDDPRSDWRFVLSSVGRAITLSSYTERVIKEAMGLDFRVCSIPVPVPVRVPAATRRRGKIGGGNVELMIRGTVIDSSVMGLSADLCIPSASIEIRSVPQAELCEAVPPRAGPCIEPVPRADFRTRWLTWMDSCIERMREVAWKPLPAFSAVKAMPNPEARVTINGIVYTSMFNPKDGRKNWIDLVTAFCWAFRDTADATLILKIVHKDLKQHLDRLVLALCRLSPFKCRVLMLHGYLDDHEYETLISATTYYVNTSNCEGLCLPLMEFMARAKPAIAPAHTAMADYIDQSVSLVLRSSLECNAWPLDPRQRFRTMHFRLDWESLLGAFRQSYQLAKTKPEEYSAMAARAQHRMREYSSIASVKERIRNFFHDLDTAPADENREVMLWQGTLTRRPAAVGTAGFETKRRLFGRCPTILQTRN